MTAPVPDGHSDREHGGRRPRLPAWALAAVLGLSGAATVTTGFLLEPAPPAAVHADSAASTRPPVTSATTTPVETVQPGPPSLPRSVPTSIHIPAIDVRAPVTTLGLNPDHTVEVPTDFSQTGWYRHGPTPGETGPAVILGHVDSHRGPAVFYRLDQLTPGDRVHIARADGTTATFRVEAIGRYPKTAFPTDRVYGPTPGAELRLITCGGRFNTTTRSYTDNIVAYAHLDPTTQG